MTPEDPIPLNRLERGRDLTDHECATFLADRQTALRHGTAPIAVEVADTYREAAQAAESRVALLEDALRPLTKTEHGPMMAVNAPCLCVVHENARAALAEPRRNALEADL